jgi:hypothetical protein
MTQMAQILTDSFRFIRINPFYWYPPYSFVKAWLQPDIEDFCSVNLVHLVKSLQNPEVEIYQKMISDKACDAATQRRASPDTGPARHASITSAFAGAEPLKNRAVGSRVHALVGPVLLGLSI